MLLLGKPLKHLIKLRTVKAKKAKKCIGIFNLYLIMSTFEKTLARYLVGLVISVLYV